MEPNVSAEMPKYRCHKEVWALKIKSIELPRKPTISELEDIISGNSKPSDVILYPEDRIFAPINVSRDWFYKHTPEPGGYYVVYADGYKSYSPAKAFEEGYTRI